MTRRRENPGHRVGPYPVRTVPGCNELAVTPLPVQASGQLERKEDVRQLRLPVDPHPAVTPGGLQVVEGQAVAGAACAVDANATMRAGDEARQAVEQRFGQEKGAEMIDGERGLVSVDRLGALGQHEAGVVDQHVERGACSRISAAPAPNRGQVAQVEDDELAAGPVSRRSDGGDRGARPLSASRAVTSTRAPIPPSAAAVSNPMPELPPVTTTVFRPCRAVGRLLLDGRPAAALHAAAASEPHVPLAPVSRASTNPGLGRQEAPAQGPLGGPHVPQEQLLGRPPRLPRHTRASVRRRGCGSDLGSSGRSKSSGGKTRRQRRTGRTWPGRRGHGQGAVAHRDAERTLRSLVRGIGKAPLEVRRVAPVLRYGLTA